MLPCPSIKYAPNSHYADSELVSDLFVIVFSFLVKGANHLYLFLFQFCIPVVDSLFRSSLMGRIKSIYFWGAKKKVRWVNAGRIVAFVKHIKIIRYGSVFKFPRKSVSASYFWSPYSEYSIFVFAIMFGRSPFPTTIWRIFVYLFPKSLLKGSPSRLCRKFALFSRSCFCLASSRYSTFLSENGRCFRNLIHALSIHNRLRIATQML